MLKSLSSRLPATTTRHRCWNDKRVIVKGKFEMTGMRKASVSGSEPRRRFLLIKKVTGAFLPKQVPQEPRLIRPHLKSP